VRLTQVPNTPPPVALSDRAEDISLLGDHAASDAVARIARWVRLHVVGLGMNHERGPSVRKQGMIAGAQIHTLICQFRLRCAIGLNSKVRHVTRMRSLGIIEAMVLLVGIEVRTGRRECRPLALGYLMKVCGMLAGR